MRSWDHWTGRSAVLCSSVFVSVCVGVKINFAFACRRRSSITSCGGRSFGLGDIWDCPTFWNGAGSGSFGCLWWDVAWSLSLSPLPMHLRQPLAGAAWGPAAAPDCYQYPPATSHHQHFPQQEFYAGEFPCPLLHPGGCGEGPAAGRAGRVHQPGCLPGWVMASARLWEEKSLSFHPASI